MLTQCLMMIGILNNLIPKLCAEEFQYFYFDDKTPEIKLNCHPMYEMNSVQYKWQNLSNSNDRLMRNTESYIKIKFPYIWEQNLTCQTFSYDFAIVPSSIRTTFFLRRKSATTTKKLTTTKTTPTNSTSTSTPPKTTKPTTTTIRYILLPPTTSTTPTSTTTPKTTKTTTSTTSTTSTSTTTTTTKPSTTKTSTTTTTTKPSTTTTSSSTTTTKINYIELLNIKNDIYLLVDKDCKSSTHEWTLKPYEKAAKLFENNVLFFLEKEHYNYKGLLQLYVNATKIEFISPTFWNLKLGCREINSSFEKKFTLQYHHIKFNKYKQLWNKSDILATYEIDEFYSFNNYSEYFYENTKELACASSKFMIEHINKSNNYTVIAKIKIFYKWTIPNCVELFILKYLNFSNSADLSNLFLNYSKIRSIPNVTSRLKKEKITCSTIIDMRLMHYSVRFSTLTSFSLFGQSSVKRLGLKARIIPGENKKNLLLIIFICIIIMGICLVILFFLATEKLNYVNYKKIKTKVIALKPNRLKLYIYRSPGFWVALIVLFFWVIFINILY